MSLLRGWLKSMMHSLNLDRKTAESVVLFCFCLFSGHILGKRFVYRQCGYEGIVPGFDSESPGASNGSHFEEGSVYQETSVLRCALGSLFMYFSLLVVRLFILDGK